VGVTDLLRDPRNAALCAATLRLAPGAALKGVVHVDAHNAVKEQPQYSSHDHRGSR